MITSAHLPVLVAATKYAHGWPEHETSPVVTRYVPLSTALTRRYSTDAHFAAYSVPSVPRRLADESVFAALIARGIDGVTMVLLVVDVDGDGHAATPEWCITERAKIDRLLAAHPGGFIYWTRGGYRIVYVLAEPHVIRSRRDADRWSAWHLATLDYLRAHFAIDGDVACKEWQRLYRLPHTTRDGRLQELDTIGGPAVIGPWDVHVVVPEPAVVPARSPSSVVTPSGASCEELVRAWYPGVAGRSDSGGTRYDIECPWEHEHHIKSKRSTSVWIAPGGGGSFKCLHTSCKETHARTWEDLRRFHEPSWRPYDPTAPRHSNRTPDERALRADARTR